MKECCEKWKMIWEVTVWNEGNASKTTTRPTNINYCPECGNKLSEWCECKEPDYKYRVSGEYSAIPKCAYCSKPIKPKVELPEEIEGFKREQPVEHISYRLTINKIIRYLKARE